MHVIVGLGNPGDRYASTRHNVGAWVVERASSRWSVTLSRTALAREGSGWCGSVPILLATPSAWMNQSGPVVEALLDREQLFPDALIVVHDDLDLELGRLRFRRAGGHGGHNGIRSIITALGTDQFARLKIGIGRPRPGLEPAEYVLTPFFADERPIIDRSVNRAVLAIDCLVRDGWDAATNRFSGLEPKKPAGPAASPAADGSDHG